MASWSNSYSLPVRTTEDERRLQLTEALIATGEGDRRAFRQVYKLTSAKLFGICLRICTERQAAEDVLHEAYLTVWRRADTFEPGRSSPITWLATIARNRAIDWRRAQGVRRFAPFEEILELPDPALLPSEAMERQDGTARLLECLAALEERQRSAIRTAFFEGVTYSDLAERQSVPLGTMKSWVRRGLAGLRRCLET